MRVDWRGTLTVAVAAFLLSVLVGWASGVALGTLVLRALLAAIVFGAGATAVTVVVGRYLPGLLQASADGGASGSRVDLVVDGDVVPDGVDDFLPGGPSGTPSELDEDGSDGFDDAEADVTDPEFDSPARAVGLDSHGSSAARERYDEPQELEELHGDSDADDATDHALPDIGGLGGGFTTEAPEEDADPGSGRSREDGLLMARAIRTVLKREG